MSRNGIKAGDCEAGKGAISCREENLEVVLGRCSRNAMQLNCSIYIYLEGNFFYGISKSGNIREKISV